MAAIDPNQENGALLMAIHGVVTADGPAARENLYKTMIASQLYMVTINNEPGTSGPLELKGGEQLQLATIRAPDGKIFLPVFSDLKRLQVSLPPNGRWVPAPMQIICQMFMQGDAEGIVINPGQPPSGLVTKPEAQFLANGAIPRVDENGQLTGEIAQQQLRIEISKPKTPPDESFINAIQDSARTFDAIEEVHVFSAGVEKQAIKLVIGMLMRDGMEPADMQPAFEAVGQAAYDARGNTEEFDMMPLNRDVVETIRPLEGLVYKRDLA